jgi:hypothetical protein
MTTRRATLYATFPPWLARTTIFAVLLLMVGGFWAQGYSQRVAPQAPNVRDESLYIALVLDIEQGRDYYESAAARQRSLGYPISPPVVFRQPWLARFLAIVRVPALPRSLLLLLSICALLGPTKELVRAKISPFMSIVLATIACSGFAEVVGTNSIYHHDVWAGVLVALSLSVYRRDRWIPSIIFGLLACLIRELSAPYLIIMGLVAWYRHERREAVGWAVAAMVFGLLYAIHILEAARIYRSGDLISPGWVKISGLSFVAATARFNGLVRALPPSLSILALTLAVLGLVGWRDDRSRAAGALIVFYILMFIAVGRPENDYWGLLYAPLLGFGLMLAAPACIDLFDRALERK